MNTMHHKVINNISVGIVLLLCIVATHSAGDELVNPARPRQCYSCEGINCQRPSKLNATVECTDLLDICVTVFNGFTVVARGCYADLPEAHRSKCDSETHSECVKCYGQLCNNKGRDAFKCITCRSSENAKCARDTSAMTPTLCDVPTAPNSYCYVRQSPDDGGIERGCYVHQQQQLACLSDAQCSLCLTEYDEPCNSYRLLTATESGAAAAMLSLGAALTAILLRVL